MIMALQILFNQEILHFANCKNLPWLGDFIIILKWPDFNVGGSFAVNGIAITFSLLPIVKNQVITRLLHN